MPDDKTVRGRRRAEPPKRRWRFTEPAVLLMLRSGPAHGYELLKRLPTVVPAMQTPNDSGFIYRVLRGLEEEGAVRSHWSIGDGPARRVYELTEAGGEQIEGWRVQLTRELKAIHGLLEEYLDSEPTQPPRDRAGRS